MMREKKLLSYEKIIIFLIILSLLIIGSCLLTQAKEKQLVKVVYYPNTTKEYTITLLPPPEPILKGDWPVALFGTLAYFVIMFFHHRWEKRQDPERMEKLFEKSRSFKE